MEAIYTAPGIVLSGHNNRGEADPNILTLPTRSGKLCFSSHASVRFSPFQPASLPSSPSDCSSYYDSSKPQGQKSRLLLRTLVKKH